MGDAVVVPDCKALVDGWEDIQQGRPKLTCANADIWHDINQLAKERRGSITLRRVNSHLDWCQAKHMGMSMHDWIGNKTADALADRGAAMGALPTPVLDHLDRMLKKMGDLHRRMVFVHTAALAKLGPDEQHTNRVPLPFAARRHLEASGHRVHWHTGGRFAACSRCGQCTTAGKFRAWIRTAPCVPLVEHGDFARPPREHTPIIIGNASVHQSHPVAYFRGVWFCTACGAYTTAIGSDSGRTLVRRLGRVCQGTRNRSSAARLRRIFRGLPPRSGTTWPRKASTNSDYNLGTTIFIVGLKRSTKFNGCRATVRGFDESTGRWLVATRSGEELLVLPKCLALEHTGDDAAVLAP